MYCGGQAVQRGEDWQTERVHPRLMHPELAQEIEPIHAPRQRMKYQKTRAAPQFHAKGPALRPRKAPRS